MALRLVGKIAGDDAAKEAQLCIEYDPQPPYDAGAPSKAGPVVTEKARATVKDIVAKTLVGVLALFGRLPSARVDGSSCRRPKTCTGAEAPAPRPSFGRRFRSRRSSRRKNDLRFSVLDSRS
jgi:hypothetical protein